MRAANTDVDGAIGALARHGTTGLAGADVLIVGAGGTARAMLAALARLGSTSVRVLARRPAAAQADLAPVAEAFGVRLVVGGLTAGTIGRPDLLVATTPAGAFDEFAEAGALAVVVFDVLYHPWPTALVAAATEPARQWSAASTSSSSRPPDRSN